MNRKVKHRYIKGLIINVRLTLILIQFIRYSFSIRKRDEQIKSRLKLILQTEEYYSIEQ